MPFMPELDGDNTQEEEDDAVGQCCHCLDSILHSRVALLGDVQEGVALLDNTASNLIKFLIQMLYDNHSTRPL